MLHRCTEGSVMDFVDLAISMCNSMWYALDTKIDIVIIFICILCAKQML